MHGSKTIANRTAGRPRRRGCSLAIALFLALVVCGPALGSGAVGQSSKPKSGSAGEQAKKPPRPIPGRKAPDFTLSDLTGKKVRLADFRADERRKLKGEVVVLVWWSATGPVVAKSDPTLVRLERRYRTRGVRFFAINPFGKATDQAKPTAESLRVIRKFKKLRGITFPVLIDVKRKVTSRYHATRLPEVVVIDRNGVLRYRGAVVSPPVRGARATGVPHLEHALEDLLAGRVLRRAETEPWGNTIP